MEQISNSLLGKAVHSRGALRSVGRSLLREGQSEENQPFASAGLGSAQQKVTDTSPTTSPTLNQPEQNAANFSEQRANFAPSRSDEPWVPLIDPRKLFGAIANAKKLIAFTSVAGLMIGILYATSLPKYYYSSAEILIDPRDLQISDRELLPTGLPYDASLALVENQTRILTSRRVILGTVEKLNLDQDAEYNGKGLAAPGPIQTLKAIIFGSDSDDPAKAKEIAVENLLEVTGVSRAPKTFVISLTVRSENPEKAALIANTMAAVYMDVQDEIQSDTVGRANGELGGRLEELRTDVEKAERLVEAYRSENELFDANGKLISDDEISLSSTQLTRAREKVAELRARADSARELTLDAVLSDALPEGAASNLIADLRRGYSLKVQQRDALSEKLGAQHPQLRTAEAEVISAQRGIETELRRLSQTAQIELQRAIKTEQDLAAGQARLKSKKSAISDSLVRLRELEREAAARRSVYESLLLRARETGQQAGISTANTTIVSQAVPPLRPYGTSRKVIAVGGLIAGFFAGIVFALMGALWRAFTIIEPDGQPRLQSPATSPVDVRGRQNNTQPMPNGGGEQIYASDTRDPEPTIANDNPSTNQGQPMYYPYPMPQPNMMHAQGFAPQPVMQYPAPPQQIMPQQTMPQQIMPQHYIAQMAQQPHMMPHMLQPYPYLQPQMMQHPVMQQSMMPQMMQPYPYVQPQMMQPQIMQSMMQPQMVQPMMQPQMFQPVYVVAQHQSPVFQQAPANPPVPANPFAPAQTNSDQNSGADYSEIRGRLEALRSGIGSLAEGRDRLSKLG